MNTSVQFKEKNHILNNMKLVMLHEFSLLLNSCYKIELILKESAKKIREVTNSDGCHIMFCQGLMDRLKLETAIHDTEIPFPPNIDLAKGKVAQETFHTGKYIIIEDTSVDPRIIQKAREYLGHRSMAAVPIVVKGESVGAIVVYSKNVSHYTHGDGHFLMMLGNHLGLAVENARLLLELEKAATMDSLTGAFNHRYLRSQLSALVDVDIKVPVSLIMIDVDNFKSINDTYGHLAGDYVLQEVTNVLKNEIRKHDIITRYGGDEFAIVLPGADSSETEIIGKRMEYSIASHHFSFGIESFGVTISWGGVTLTPAEITCINDVIKLADCKLYEMKNIKKIANRKSN